MSMVNAFYKNQIGKKYEDSQAEAHYFDRYHKQSVQRQKASVQMVPRRKKHVPNVSLTFPVL